MHASGSLPLLLLLLTLSVSCRSGNKLREEIRKRSGEENSSYEMALLIGEYADRYPGDLEQLAEYSQLLLEKGYHRESVLLADEVIRKDSTLAAAWHTRGLAKIQMWRFSSGLSDLEKYCSLQDMESTQDPDYRRSRILLGIYRDIQQIDHELGNNPDAAHLYRKRADLLLKMNRPLAARADYRCLFEMGYTDDDFIINLLRADFILEEFNEARKDLEKFREQYPASSLPGIDLFANLVRTALDLQKSRPPEVEYRTEIARILATAKLEDRAIDHLEKALRADPGNLNLKYRLAVLHVMKNDLETARRLAKELQEAGFNLPEQFTEQLK